jgi:hypothetical protein
MVPVQSQEEAWTVRARGKKAPEKPCGESPEKHPPCLLHDVLPLLVLLLRLERRLLRALVALRKGVTALCLMERDVQREQGARARTYFQPSVSRQLLQ